MSHNQLKLDLHSPYLSLTPGAIRTFYGDGLIQIAETLSAGGFTHPVWFQRQTPAYFREDLIKETGVIEYAATTPDELQLERQSALWRRLVHLCCNWNDLEEQFRTAVIYVLSGLGYYEHLLSLLENQQQAGKALSPEQQAIRGMTTIRLARSGDLDETLLSPAYEDIKECALNAGATSIRRLRSSLNAALFALTYLRDLPRSQSWIDMSLRLLPEVRADFGDFVATLEESCIWRAAAMIPFAEKEGRAVRRQMDLCRDLAESLIPTSDTETLLRTENLYSVWESSAKEAMFLGEWERAERYLSNLVDTFPFDSKALLGIGELFLTCGRVDKAYDAYSRAAAYAPPGCAIALFMAGQCAEQLDDKILAFDNYTRCLATDPLGLSAAEQIKGLCASSCLPSGVERLAQIINV